MTDPRQKPGNPFATLAALRDALPPGDPLPVAPGGEPVHGGDPLTTLMARKIVVRRERKGRGGKTVTLVQLPEGTDGTALDALAREIRTALGTGAQREGDTLVAVQGDIPDRVATWLAGRGAGRIVRG